jgi:thiol:disulfide interchange protein
MLTLLFFAFYIRSHISRKFMFDMIFFALPILLIAYIHQDIVAAEKNGGKEVTSYSKAGMTFEPWSVEKLNKYKEEQTTVFIDFTAKWCFTCKANEKLVIDTDAFRNLMGTRNVRLLLADWTKKDPKIGNWLKEHDKVGVPAYFIQRPNGDIVDLGETISISELKEVLDN